MDKAIYWGWKLQLRLQNFSLEPKAPAPAPKKLGLAICADDLQWNTIFDGRQPSMEDDLQWKTTFDGRPPLMEDNPISGIFN